MIRASAPFADDLWTPRPRDLPSARAVRLAPELAGIEHNPVFRRARHRQRLVASGSRRFLWIAPMLVVALLLAKVVVNPTGANLASAVAGIALLVVLQMAWNWKNPKTLVGGLTVQEWGELADAGYPPGEAAIGLWGSALPREIGPWTGMADGFAMGVGGLVGAILASGFRGGSDFDQAAMFLAMSGFEMGRGVVIARNPHGALHEMRRGFSFQMLAALGGLRGETEPEKGLGTFRSRFLFTMLVAIAGAALSMRGQSAPVVFGASLLSGAGFASASWRTLTRDAPSRLAELTDDVAEAMRRARIVLHPESS